MANVESNGVGDGEAIATNVSSEGRMAAAVPAGETNTNRIQEGHVKEVKARIAIHVGENVSRLNTSNCILSQ